MSYRVAVVGATGNVGREILNTLVERKFPISERNSYSNNPREIPQYIGFSWTLENLISFAENFLSFSNHRIPNHAADQRGDWSRIFQKGLSIISSSQRAS